MAQEIERKDMMTNTVLAIQREMNQIKRRIVENERRQDALEERQDRLFYEWFSLLADLEALAIRYEDSLMAPRLREQGAAAVADVEEILTESWRQTWPWGEVESDANQKNG